MNVLVVTFAPPASRLEGSLAQWTVTGPAPEPAGPPGASLIEQVEAAVARGHERVVVDLGALASLDTDEVKLLTDFAWAIRVAGGQPVIASPHRDVTDALRHLKLDRAFAVHPSLPEAIRDAGFGDPPG